MNLTPNYSFIIPTGSDAVNLLTQCYPNFTSLDSILKPIQESGVTVATDTKVGTVHQLIRTDSSCNMFRFIATGNYESGDTFTVDGASVTATAMDGTSLPAGAFVINQSVVCVLNNLVLTVLIAGKKTASLPSSAVTYDNTVSGLTATNAQDAFDELHDSDNIAYDNTISGLTATDVKSAIDEIARGGSATHGLYELWANPSPNADFGAQPIEVSSDVQYDSIWLEIGLTKGETLAPDIKAIDLDEGITNTTLRSILIAGFGANEYVTANQCSRSLSVAYDNVTHKYTFTFGACTRLYKASNLNTAGTSVTDNTYMIIYRIVGLIHNT